MILTGEAIKQAYIKKEIIIEPFEISHINPNSYNFRLGKTLLQARKYGKLSYDFEKIQIPLSGFVLKPKTLYLAATYELLGSKNYVMTLLGRSSIGRLGLFLNITADLGHIGAVSQWTLEITVVQPLKIYPYMKIGQIAFWKIADPATIYSGRYNENLGPVSNKDLSLELGGGI